MESLARTRFSSFRAFLLFLFFCSIQSKSSAHLKRAAYCNYQASLMAIYPRWLHSAPSHFLRPRLRGLYVITDERMGGGHLAIAHAALAGGAAIIQLRDKTTPLNQLLPLARELRHLTRAANALLLINDRIDLALAVAADGVHLGPNDMPPMDARRILGSHRLLGVSSGNPDEARAAAQAGADYIGGGAIFVTATKSDAGPAIGLDALRCIVEATTLPVAAIGGLDQNNITFIRAAGVTMACVISAVAKAGDAAAMTEATRALIQAGHL